MIRVWVLPVLALICAVLWGAIRLVMRVPVRRVTAEALFAGYLGAMLYVVFFLPLPVRPNETRLASDAINLVPTHTVVRIFKHFHQFLVLQVIGNVVMFVPLGFFLPLLSTRNRRFARTATIGLAVSVGIELVQLAMLLTLNLRRSVDVDDVILNVTGACCGYLIWRGAYALTRPRFSAFANPQTTSAKQIGNRLSL